MTWGTLEEEVVECFQRPQWQCGAAKVAASRVRESWIPRRKKHNCSSTTWEGSMEQAPSKHSRGPGEPFMCGSPPSFAPRGRGHILITKRSPNRIACIINEWEKDSCVCCLLYQAFFFWNLQDQKVHRYFGSSQLGTSWNQPLGSTPEMSNTRYHSLLFAVFALRLVGCDNVCCSSLVLSITAGSGRFPAVNSQSIYVPFGLVNSKKKKIKKYHSLPDAGQTRQMARRGSNMPPH